MDGILFHRHVINVAHLLAEVSEKGDANSDRENSTEPVALPEENDDSKQSNSSYTPKNLANPLLIETLTFYCALQRMSSRMKRRVTRSRKKNEPKTTNLHTRFHRKLSKLRACAPTLASCTRGCTSC